MEAFEISDQKIAENEVNMNAPIANCRFEHPGANSNSFGGQSNNRFSALSSGGVGGNSGGSGRDNRDNRDGANPYKITKDLIRIDLMDERPAWILSSYGPGRDAPEQLFGGHPREQSFEEIRLLVTGSPNTQQALQQVQQLFQQAEQQTQASLNNLDGAVQFILSAENKHPNRNDICKQMTREGGTNGTFAVGNTAGGFLGNPLNAAPVANQNPFGSTQASPFGAPAAATTTPSAFGQPSALGAKPNPFASSAPAFGQPSQMGATGGTAFGQPSQLGSAGGSAFGQPSSLGVKPNPFGAPSGPSGFAQASQQGNAFGQPSSLGQRSNAFGAASASPFGAPTQPQNVTVTQNPFGAPAQPQNAATAHNPFGAPAQPQHAVATQNPFGAPAQSQNPAAAQNPFGQPAQPSSFGVPAAANPFTSNAGAAPQNQAMDTSAPSNSNPFGPSASTGFGVPSNSTPVAPQAPTQSKSPYPPGSSKQHPEIGAYATTLGNRLRTFKGRPVVYKDEKPGTTGPGGVWQKIWFPDGAPAYYRATEAEDPASYTNDVRKAYEDMQQTGRFNGDMPTVPPMREDCVWNF